MVFSDASPDFRRITQVIRVLHVGHTLEVLRCTDKHVVQKMCPRKVLSGYYGCDGESSLPHWVATGTFCRYSCNVSRHIGHCSWEGAVRDITKYATARTIMGHDLICHLGRARGLRYRALWDDLVEEARHVERSHCVEQ